ncbi:MAG: DtxR family transcriptional regulator [Deltaproteobacteria bacterium]|nr:DtxR family transcriptional regulator [Deltaproteobacteria bacterium]
MTDAANTVSPSQLSSALEDYLETIYLLVQQNGFARVKEIAKAREVKAASVSIALRRLAELDLVQYVRREYVALTPRGEQLGRRVFARHRLLTRFFEEVLQMPAEAAGQQACAMEHSLTDEAMNRLASFFEFLGSCSKVPPHLLQTFRTCPIGKEQLSGKGAGVLRPLDRPCAACRERQENKAVVHLSDLKPGQTGRVSQITAQGMLRQRLLDLGILPDAAVDLERVGLGGDPVWIRCQGAQLALRRTEARSILVVKS